ncbi:hypothetical protein AVEN_210329-1 [Araneus ventricosus]|uniref:Uncharacterized protein n=1 Tax=Araneus ventricosus TaxID=182803 RepID=A0A4Y2SJ76_ARAVE|nr:hypothetical protein AVEN_210329-1 [Araneus ventricosus]
MFRHKALLDELCSETLEFRGLFFSEELMYPSMYSCHTSGSISFCRNGFIYIDSIVFQHFCTAFAISSPRVCPESGSNPSSFSFGPWDDIYLTKRETCAVYFMSQGSSIASDKAEAS